MSVNVEFPTGNALADTSRKMEVDGFRQAKGGDRTSGKCFPQLRGPEVAPTIMSPLMPEKQSR